MLISAAVLFGAKSVWVSRAESQLNVQMLYQLHVYMRRIVDHGGESLTATPHTHVASARAGATCSSTSLCGECVPASGGQEQSVRDLTGRP